MKSTSPSKFRVAVTGLGVVSAVGVGREKFWRALTGGVSGVTPVSSFPTDGYRSRLGGEVRDFAGPKDTYRYAEAAAREALADAGLSLDAIDKSRAGVVLGTTFGECLSVQKVFEELPGASLAEVERAARRFFPAGIPARLARELGFGGPNLMLTTACAAGNFTLAVGLEKLRSGAAGLVLAGGVDLFSEITYAGFSRLLAVAPEACAPFSKGRQGMIPGEGCAILVLEPWDAAIARGAKPYAELLGCGVSSDAKHVTAPDESGVERAVRRCLENSGLSAAEVDYVNAHGTGTPANDKAESAALARVFGPKAPPVSSIKSMLGHAMGAASALEAAACCLSLRTGVLPPTINYTPGDPDCGLDFVPDGARKTDPKVVLSDAFAFGGSNCVAAFASPGVRPEPLVLAEMKIVVTGLATVERRDDPIKAAEAELGDLDLRFIDAPIAYALSAVRLALKDAGIPERASDDVGIVLDSSGEIESQRRFHADLRAQGPQGVEPRLFPNILANAAAGRAAILFGLKLVNMSAAGSFPSGEAAAVLAAEVLRRGGAGAVVAGGVWDCASLLVLETEDRARARGARIYAEFLVESETFKPLDGPDPREPSDCFCLVHAVRKAAKGFSVAYTGKGVWGGEIRLVLEPPAGLT